MSGGTAPQRFSAPGIRRQLFASQSGWRKAPASAIHLPMPSPVDPLAAVTDLVQSAAAEAFDLPRESIDPLVRPSDKADLQANLAMGLAKRLGRPPREVAAKLAAAIPKEGPIARIEVAGPGFLNVTLSSRWLSEAATKALSEDRLAVPLAEERETVVIDYSHPNVAKEMHVGHLRSSIIGDALARVLEFRGHTVVRQNHIGDWGTPFGMLIEHMLDLGDAHAERDLAVGDLTVFYQAARKKFDEDSAFADRSRRRVVLLQAGDEATLFAWRRLVDLSIRYFELVYDKLGITLKREHVCGESFYNPRLAPLADELLRIEKAVVNDGAVCLFPAGFKNKEGEPLPLIVRKRDGGFGYATTDLAAIRYRVAELGATRILYVVGAPQAQHLAMVIQAARELGWLYEGVRAEHVAFGSILGTDKRMFRTRSGDTVRLIDLVDAAIDRAESVVAEKAPELEPSVQRDVARMVGTGAIKYADLSNDRLKDYVFDLERMVSFDGNTAGYLQYAHARIQSIFRKAGGDKGSGVIKFGDDASGDAERALVLLLLRFGPVVEAVETTLEPHRLAGHLYAIATAFSTFYEKCAVLKAESDVRASRLSLCQLTARTLAQGLDLLGIEAPDRM
jgi:arginyl-tRNA synthetase